MLIISAVQCRKQLTKRFGGKTAEKRVILVSPEPKTSLTKNNVNSTVVN